MLEAKTHTDILFVTLTYKDQFLPREIYNLKTGEIEYEHHEGCLDKRAIQLFLKRLRKKLPPNTLRFFACGEYGPKTRRPHYHLVLFGLPYSLRRFIYEAWCCPVTRTPMADPDRIDVQIPRSDWDVSQYCCAYVTKKLTKKHDPRLDGRPPEFYTSSQGLGRGSISELATALRSHSASNYIADLRDIPTSFTSEGKILPIDRYVRGKILDALGIKEMATETARQKYDEEMHALLLRAQANPEIKKKGWLIPTGDEKKDAQRFGWAMEEQSLADNEAKIAQKDRKQQLYNPTNGEF